MIEQANAIPILNVLRDFMGMDLPDSGSRSWKDYCPFGFEHGDGGRDKGWRVYPSTNSSYCFVMHGSMDPVRLISLRKEVSAKKAAYLLLENYGMLKGRGWRERYDSVVIAREQRVHSVGSPVVLVEALHSALRQEPGYVDKQFDTEFSAALEGRLNALDELLTAGADEASVREWFVRSREQLTKELA